MKEYNRHSANIEANEVVPKADADMQDYKIALPFIEKALSTNNKNPKLLSLAALIKEKVDKNQNNKDLQ